MKKIIIAFLGLAFLFTGQSVFASVSWNTASNDCRSISIANATTSSGWAHPCWTGTSISADAGERVSVRIYYHNTGNTTATNTKVKLNKSGNSFSGQIISDQGNLSFGPVYANISSDRDLTFESVRWYTENTNETLTPLLNGQSGSQVLNSGLNIGSIAPGWATQGSVVVSFRVDYDDNNNNNNNNDDDECSIDEFTIDGKSSVHVDEGDSVNIVWETTDCRTVEVDGPDFDSNSKDGDDDFDAEEEGTYRIKAYGYDGSYETDTVRVYIDDEEEDDEDKCEIVDFYSNTTSVVYGQPAVLYWYTENCDYVNISGIGTHLPTSYNRVIYPINTQNYTLTAFGEGKDPDESLKIYVTNFTPAPTPTPTPAPKIINTTTTTNTNNTIRTTTRNTVASRVASSVALEIENRQKNFCLKDNIDYVITYANISNKTLNDAVLQIVLPREISYVNASDGFYDKDRRTITIYLEDLRPGQEDTIYLEGKVSNFYNTNPQIVTTATLVYTTSGGAQENAIAYVINNPGNCGNSLAGAAFFAGFWGMGIIGWLLLIIIILLIILIIRRYYYHDRIDTEVNNHH